jgi:hypothetical protein
MLTADIAYGAACTGREPLAAADPQRAGVLDQGFGEIRWDVYGDQSTQWFCQDVYCTGAWHELDVLNERALFSPLRRALSSALLSATEPPRSSLATSAEENRG